VKMNKGERKVIAIAKDKLRGSARRSRVQE
jgi:hypothetical protein